MKIVVSKMNLWKKGKKEIQQTVQGLAEPRNARKQATKTVGESFPALVGAAGRCSARSTRYRATEIKAA